MGKSGRRVLYRIVGCDGVLSKRDEIHRKRRKTLRTRHEGQAGETASSDFERLEKEILVLREQLNRAAEKRDLERPATDQAG